MSRSHPSGELSVEQLVRALAQILNPDSPLRRNFLDLQPQKIYDIEHDLSAVLQKIRATRNTHVPANRLPPEILSKVLEYRTCEHDLVQATHVCQYWRSTLVSSPILWSCVRLQYSPDLDRTPTYLERSKSTPIDVRITVRDLDVIKYVVPHIARTKSLIIDESHDTHPASFLFCNPAPHLQRLEIHSTNRDFVCLPDNFLGQQASSLRFVNFHGIRPTLETLFPLPNLTEFKLHLEDTDPFPMSALFLFFSESPLLQKICINIASQTAQDSLLDRVISLESLEELEYTCYSGDRVLIPYLKLPRLKKFQLSSSIRPGEVQKLADILPYDGRVLLAGTIKMTYHPNSSWPRVDLSGNGLRVSVTTYCPMEYPSFDWFSDQSCIPFDQIEDLEVDGYSLDVNLHINVFAFKNLRALQIFRCDGEFGERFLRLLHPDPVAGVPCQSLRRIECARWTFPESYLRSLTKLVRKRKQAGYQLELLFLTTVEESDQDLVKGLREHVGEVQVGEWDAGIW